MRDDVLRELIREQNPWWRAAAVGEDPLGWTVTDRTLRARQSYDLGYRSDVLDDVGRAPLGSSLHLLRGPRRVGKSVVLKDFIARLCSRPDVDPWQIIYLPADTLSAQDLRRAVVLATEITRVAGDAVRVWVIDEITAVEGWTAELKSLRDNTRFGDDTVILTGSSAAGAAQAVRDLGAGRTGEARHPFRLVLPMTFRQYLSAVEPELPTPGPFPPWAVQTPEAADAAGLLETFTNELDLAWQRYLEAGGFPRAVFEHHRHGSVSTVFLRELESWLTADVDPSAPQESVALLLGEVQQRSSSPLNVRSLAETLGLSRSYLATRLNRIVSTFAGLWCHQVDEQGRRVGGAQSKLYLVDPLLAWLGHYLRAGLPVPDFTHLTEASLAVTVARVVEAHSPGRWLAGDTVGYARTASGAEVDVAAVPINGPAGGEQTPPLEVKWVPSGWRPAAAGLARKCGRGIVATKTATDYSGPVWALPAPVVSLLLS
ncbi:ATP-binding protein [Natronosporangium hydrolyticum]|uniref:ATP-binding protein n=1 Tax=Natronosporangium hydrolyticum TaxID=2811111 RepID=A0A895YDL6_9ACTN|nr:AAA family ATPase [Natronosporangium hydrolyticum]QSB13543.1 ATP-binding protein [Natronosporangium hydrolyticum]